MQRVSASRIQEAQKTLRHLNAFVNFAPQGLASKDEQKRTESGPIDGLHIAVKDNICTKDLPTTCASRGLETFTSPFDATAVARLRDAGVIISGKTGLDEFGMGSHNVHSACGTVRSSFGSRSAGGSSGGSAVAVATGQCHAALGTDTGGSVRQPAAFNGIYGFKPSYGRISRWGVVAYANSLDTVGLLADDLPTLKALYDRMDAHDEQDPTSIDPATRSRIQEILQARKPKHGLRFGVPEQYVLEETSSTVRQAWSKTLEYLLRLGHTVQTISLPRTREALCGYYTLAPAEASSNLAKYDGVRYGSQLDSEGTSSLLYAANRQKALGEEVRRRILLGAYSLSASAMDNFFIQAQRIRRLVQDDFNRVLELPNVLGAVTPDHGRSDAEDRVDAIICPTSTDLPPQLEDIQKQDPVEAYAGDILTAPASLAGLPSLNVPVGIDEFLEDASYDGPPSVGMQVITQYGDDHAALAIGKMMQPLRHLSIEQAHAAWLQSLVQPWIERQAADASPQT